jgi:hypothetical protein
MNHRNVAWILVLIMVRHDHGLISYINTKAKCHHLKQWTRQGKVFIGVYRLEIQSVILILNPLL